MSALSDAVSELERAIEYLDRAAVEGPEFAGEAVVMHRAAAQELLRRIQNTRRVIGDVDLGGPAHGFRDPRTGHIRSDDDGPPPAA